MQHKYALVKQKRNLFQLLHLPQQLTQLCGKQHAKVTLTLEWVLQFPTQLTVLPALKQMHANMQLHYVLNCWKIIIIVLGIWMAGLAQS